jgi:parallel beta-helix repeat protein
MTEEGFYKLIQDNRVDKVYYDFPIHAFLNESASIINAKTVWNNLNYTGKGIKVCVIDTGVDRYHPALSGKIAGEHCYNFNDKCPDGTSEDNNASDDNGHGTHVTGIIVSQDSTYRGIAYNSSIYSVKILDSQGNGGSWDDIGHAIEWCISQGVNIISMSLGAGGPYNETNCPSTIDTDINNATNHKISVIVASGNDFFTTGIAYPACSQNVISVGATTKQELITDYTNRGDNLDLLAPGGVWDEIPAYSEIVSTFSQRVKNDNDLCLLYDYYWWWPWWPFSPYCKDEDYVVNENFIRVSGTSQATPMVAGAVALMLEKNSTLTPSQIKDILKGMGKPIWDPETQQTYPLIDIFAAIEQVPFCECTNWSIGSCGTGGCLNSQKPHTRTCNPSGCNFELICIYDTSCTPSGPGSSLELTVCASGCNYTSIQNAIYHSDSNDKVLITDNRTYSENVVMNSTTTHRLECQSGAIISGPGGYGISVYDVDDFAIIGCYITEFGRGIYLNNAQRGLIQNNTLFSNTDGIYLENESEPENEIIYNNIIAGEDGQDAIRLKASTWSNSNNHNNIENNIIIGHADKGILIDYGIYTLVKNNTIYDDGDYGIHVNGRDTNGWSTLEENIIYGNLNGIYIQQSRYTDIIENIFCSSNTNLDISSYNSIDLSGYNNRCEKPGVWNDSGTTGCTYYCDNPATSILLFFPNNYVGETANINLTCECEDDSQLKNISLYSNISGTWQKNQTKNITGTLNITTFNIYNLVNGTNFIWNCFAYDNNSRGSFASSNWSLNIIIPPDFSPNTTLISPANNSTDNDGSITFNCSATDDNNLVNISLYGNWSGSWSVNETKSLTGISNSTTFTKNLPNGFYKWNCLSYDSVSQKDWADANWTVKVNITTLPNDTYKFYHKNLTGQNVAWLGSAGNIVLKGKCFSGGNCNSPGSNSIIFGNSTDSYVAFINSTGDLCLEKGDCSDESANCNSPSGSSFIVRNSTNNNVIYIDRNGELCLTGRLYQNSNP